MTDLRPGAKAALRAAKPAGGFLV